MLSDALRRLAEAEADMQSGYYLEPSLIPGLLQIEAYARAVTKAANVVSVDVDIDEVVEFRLARQRRVDFAACHFLIAEAALRWDDEVMAGQLDKLILVADRGVDIRIIPPGHGMWLEPAVLLDGSLLHLERLDGARNYTDPVVVGKYRRMLDLACAHSIDIREFL